MDSKEELLRATYKAFNARQIDDVLANLHPLVDWPNGMEGGRIHGREDVRDYWTRQWKMLDPHVEPITITEHATGETDVEVQQVVRDLAGNLLVDQIVHHVYTIRHGLIEKMEIR
jgi:SnoaL-like domain